jgi:quaternary ammonium compound-resistance protein SugE
MSIVITLGLFVAYGFASVFGLLIIKRSFLDQPAGLGLTNGISLISWELSAGVVLYAVSFLIWMRILATHQLSSSFPVAVGLSVIGTVVVSGLILNESMSVIKIAGVALVVTGIVAIGTGQ